MKITAAVLRETNAPLSIEELDLAPPKKDEVLIKVAYTGFCHSDLHLITGTLPIAMPLVLGHETAGVVEQVGPGVEHLKKGDHVVATWMIPCGKCKNCSQGKGYICTGSFENFLAGKLLDGTSRLTDKQGNEVLHQSFVSGFADYMVLPAGGAIKIREDMPLDQACFMGCCVPTGWGAVTNVADIQPGTSVAVWGVGGIGLNIIRAAASRQANPLIAVDIEPDKENIAREFGATHFICNRDIDPVPVIQSLTNGGVEVAFEAIGDPGAIVQAYWATGMGAKLVIPGLTPHDKTTDLPLIFLPLHQKSILGTIYGNISTYVDIPRYVDLSMKDNSLKLDKLITNYFRLEDINDVVHAMERREIKGRWVCKMD